MVPAQYWAGLVIHTAVQYLPWLSCMFALAPRPNRKAHSSTLLIWAAKISDVAPSWKKDASSKHREATSVPFTQRYCNSHHTYTVLGVQVGLKVPQGFCARQAATDRFRIKSKPKLERFTSTMCTTFINLTCFRLKYKFGITDWWKEFDLLLFCTCMMKCCPANSVCTIYFQPLLLQTQRQKYSIYFVLEMIYRIYGYQLC